MNKVLTSVCGGAALAALLTGCDPQLAQVQSGSQAELWCKQLKANYRSFEAPRNPAPAVYNANTAAAAQSKQTNSAPVQLIDDPEKAVDRAADGENVTPVPAKDENAVKKEEKAADKAAAPAADAKETAAPQEKKEEKAADKAAAETQKPAADTKEAAGAPQESENTGKLYVVKAGDTLGGIAQKFYGKASMEDVIFRANSKKLKNRNSLSIGMSLVIPEL